MEVYYAQEQKRSATGQPLRIHGTFETEADAMAYIESLRWSGGRCSQVRIKGNQQSKPQDNALLVHCRKYQCLAMEGSNIKYEMDDGNLLAVQRK